MTGKRIEPASGLAVWTAETLVASQGWNYQLSPSGVAEIVAAGRNILASGRHIRDVTRDDVNLHGLADDFAVMGQKLREDTGVALIRGFPVEGYSTDEIKAMYWALGAYFGVGVSQNRKGEYVGDVIDLSDRMKALRPFQRGGEQLMHRDPIDIVGLLCIRHAKSGGLSRIGSSAAVHNVLFKENPDLLARLYEGFHYHRLDEDRGTYAEITPYKLPAFARDAAGRVSCFFIEGPIRRAEKHGIEIDAKGQAAIAAFIAATKRAEMCFDMNLQPGDLQFLNNRSVMHSRTDYEDHAEFEHRRHMLRLWLMVPGWPELPKEQRYFEDEDRCGGGIAPTEMVAA